MLWSTNTNRKKGGVSRPTEKQQGTQCSNWEKIKKIVKNKKRRKTEKELQHFQEKQISDNEDKKSASSVAESVESGEISPSSSKWNLGSDELFVTCLNDNSENKIAKSIKKYLDLFIKSRLNHMSIRSRLVSQPNNKLISNNEQLFNTSDLSLITFGVILPPNPRWTNSSNSQINQGISDENKNSKVCIIKLLILLDSSAGA